MTDPRSAQPSGRGDGPPRRASTVRDFGPNAGLAAAAALVLAVMLTVVGVAVTVAEPGSEEASRDTATPAMWREPPGRGGPPGDPHS